MCIANHTLFIVDAYNFLRAYVMSHLLDNTVEQEEDSLEEVLINEDGRSIGKGCLFEHQPVNRVEYNEPLSSRQVHVSQMCTHSCHLRNFPIRSSSHQGWKSVVISVNLS